MVLLSLCRLSIFAKYEQIATLAFCILCTESENGVMTSDVCSNSDNCKVCSDIHLYHSKLNYVYISKHMRCLTEVQICKKVTFVEVNKMDSR